ncbi:alpha-galactosidase [Lactiplantibacillus fabifermentans T30PCM01]|uniref:Alpha-galactosidase n=1 Tax=Lactiplantibacillus fabifermentans T30PCM01 TaxID=1400520 RepID=W6T4M6_9LACO|nr:alpha-galactosidase [Lactiplantibacillus fabifermentans]ETY72693.1 alpha-galactosidase [Lactiplantibacillus fabifermentans T30PCM01]
MITYDTALNVFHLQNKTTSYVIGILPNGQLQHLYYGARIQPENLAYYLDDTNKAAGTVKYYEQDHKFSLGAVDQEYPVDGIGDYNEPALSLFDATSERYPDFHYDSYEITKVKARNVKVPGTFGDANQVESLHINLKDEQNNVWLTVTYSLFSDTDVISRQATLKNEATEPLQIHRMMSAALDLPAQPGAEFIDLSGAWLRERHVQRTPLVQGIHAVGSTRGASSHQHNPFVALASPGTTEQQGQVDAMLLVYSGDFLAEAELNEWQRPRLLIGIHPAHFNWRLMPGENFTTPEALLVHSEHGLNAMSQQFHQVLRQHIMNPKWLQRPNPIVFNSWETAFFDFDAEKLLKIAHKAKKLGADLFVVDDGWFGHRDSTASSLGDWIADSRKFPAGIADFSTRLHAIGMKFGLWFEPESFDPDSDLYRAHPDWVVGRLNERHSFGRGQYILDMANPAVVDHLFDQIQQAIADAEVDYIKWDMNRNITEAYSNYLPAEQQGEFMHRYMLGTYDLMGRLLQRFPDLFIENCAGGGGRFDAGMLFYSPQIWASDDSDAVERLKIQYGTSLVYPIDAISAHISAVPNQQVGRQTTLAMRNNVAKFASLGYELDPNLLSDNEQQQIKKDIEAYQQDADLIKNGRFYRIESPFESNETAWMVVSPDKRHALFGWYRILATANPSPKRYLKLAGLNENATYQIREQQAQLTGAELSTWGIRLPYEFNATNNDTAIVKGDFTSVVYHLDVK